MAVGDKIRERRLELGLSQRELAKRMGYADHSTYFKIKTPHNGYLSVMRFLLFELLLRQGHRHILQVHYQAICLSLFQFEQLFISIGLVG